ncbi:mRNA splicing protein [Clydaea vesicula]|uniref:Pre-mRNA-processing protein 45 n=1 Tax=Clydaea vesicula TaxID=447962 RepID=A0AAD5XXX3_9FUNG|nr:mRNA splicing protein [Clydaea vesicula]
MKNILPKPKAIQSKWEESDSDDQTTKISLKNKIPPYLKRKNYKPVAIEDYGDGGAFPELKFAQYPLDMGRKTAKSNAIPLQTDENGEVRYDLLLNQKQNKDKVIHSSLHDFKEKDLSDEIYERPDDDLINETSEKTRLALEKIVDGNHFLVNYLAKIKANNPKQQNKGQVAGPTYVRYTPQIQNTSSQANSRIIKMVSAPVDPMEPARFGHKKIPRQAPSPPPPVLHSPPRKVTAEEQKNWVIPPCISNWKNAKGYTIPLDKRLAADGRGVQEITINDNFAKLSEALFVADRHAREEVKIRAEMQAKLFAKEKKDKEEKLRVLAQRAREERSGISSTVKEKEEKSDEESGDSSDSDESSDEEVLDENQKKLLKERDELRREKEKQRQREIRLSHMGSETKAKVLGRSGDRDISEKIALGVAQPTMSKEGMYDQRLFNQSSGIGSGFGDDDSYNVYDKPLFSGATAASIYRPKTTAHEGYGQTGIREGDFDKLLGESNKPHKGFSGTDGEAVARDGPVQFEKEVEVDPFGLDQFMTSARGGKAENRERGSMHASCIAGQQEKKKITIVEVVKVGKWNSNPAVVARKVEETKSMQTCLLIVSSG